MRWLRCLRCDAWIPSAVPDHPTRDSIPPREEIDLPDRGPKLRDKYVLRLIALDRATHVIVLTALAIALFTFANHHTALQRDYNQIMDDLAAALAPQWLRVEGDFLIRGGIRTLVVAEHGKRP